MHSLVQAERGHHATACEGLRTVAIDGFRGVRHDWSRVATLALAAETAAVVGDVAVGEALLTQLAPFAGTLVVVASGTSCEGAVDRYLGLCARLVGDEDQACRWFHSAIQLEQQVGVPSLAARTLAELSPR
jgi:hypothetical protein